MRASRTHTIRRFVLALAAVAVGALLAVWLQSARLEARGEAVATAPRSALTPAAVRGALDDLSRAGRLTPDPRPEFLRGLLLRRTGQPAEALEQLRAVARRNPDDSEAWAWIAYLGARRDPGLLRLALRRLRELDPQRARGRD